MTIKSSRSLPLRAVGGLVLAGAVVVGAAAWAPAASAAPHRSSAPTAFHPTFTVSPTSGGPGSVVRLSGSGWKPSDTITFSLGPTFMCNLTPNASGVLTAQACTVPAKVAGTPTLGGEQDTNTITAHTTFTVVPRISYINVASVSPGAVITLYAGGLASSSNLTVKVDTTKATTNPATISSDSAGSVSNLQVTVPAATTAGTHTLTISDAAGNKATKTIHVYTPTLALSATSGSPGSTLILTGTKWRPGDSVAFYLGTSYFGSTTPDGTGAFNTALSLPGSAAGASTIHAYQETTNAVTTSKPFTVKPGHSYQSAEFVSPNSTVTVNVGGLTPSVGFSTKVGGTTVTTTGPTTTDGNGSLNSLVIPIPGNAAAGTTNIVITDNGSPAQSVKITVIVYRPTFTLSPNTGAPGSIVAVSGSGFRPVDTVNFYFQDTGNPTSSTYACGLTADDSGAVSGACSVPAVHKGTFNEIAQQDGTNIVATASHTFAVTPGFVYLSSQTVSAKGSIQIYARGLAASSAVTVKVGSSTLTVTAGAPSTDTSGNVGYLTVTLPSSLSAGPHPITVTDGSGNVAQATLNALAPTLTLSDTTVPAGSSFAVSGSGWDNGATVSFALDTAGFCSVGVDAAGDFTGACTIPAGEGTGSHTLTASQDSGAVVVSTTIHTT